MNESPASPARVRRVALAGWQALSRLHIIAILVISLSILIVKVVVLPYLLEPIVRQYLGGIEARLGERLARPVEIGFRGLNVNLSWNSIFLEVAEPYALLDGNRLEALSASLVLGFDRVPELVVAEAVLPVIEQADGTLSVAGIQPAELMLVLGDEEGATSGLVVPKLIATDTQVSFESSAGNVTRLPRLDLAFAPDLANERLVLSLKSARWAIARISGGARIPFDFTAAPADFYLRVRNLEHLLQLQSVAIEASELELDLWGRMTDFADLELKLRLRGFQIDKLLALATDPALQPELFPSPQVRAGVATVAIDLAIPEPLAAPRALQADWRVDAEALEVILPSLALGAPLTLAKLQGSGSLAAAESGWRLAADDLRVAGPVGTGSFQLMLERPPAGKLAIDLRGSSADADVGLVADLLPPALSEQGVAFMREDVAAASSQLVTIVVSGDDISAFPWPNNEGGEFTLLADLFDASLDYAEGYPPLVGADAGFGMRGDALAVTIVAGEVEGAKLVKARAAIDSLLPDDVTLYVNFAAELPEGRLEPLLATLPSTRDQSRRYLGAVGLGGSQRLSFEGAFPIHGEGKRSVNGALAFDPDGHLAYHPLTVTLQQMQGQLRFDASNVAGVVRGKALGSGVRVSLAVDQRGADMVIDGTYDIADALARLGRPLALPLAGKSGVRVRVAGSEVVLDTSLVGTGIDLPAPLGKSAAMVRPLTVTVNENLLEFSYDDDFIRARVDPATNVAAFALGRGVALPALPASGTKVRGSLEFTNLDTLLPEMFAGGGSFGTKLPLEMELELPAAQLLGNLHPDLSVGITVAGVATVASFASEKISGEAVIDASGGVRMSLAHLRLPRAETTLPPEVAAGEDVTIYVEPGSLSPPLPPLSVRIDLLEHGDRIYEDVTIVGAPLQRRWQLESLSARVGANQLRLSGDTATTGQPYTELTIDIELADINSFANNFIVNDSITAGSGRLSGNLAWRGSIIDPHYRSLTGQVSVALAELNITKDSSTARLLNLLSPFTLVQALSDIDVAGTVFDDVNGSFAFKDGDMIIDGLKMRGPDVDILVTGTTNLITERNMIDYAVTLNGSDNIASGAVSLLNPIAGGILLVFDKVLSAPLIGKVKLNYTVTGSWDEPEVELQEEIQLES